MRQSPYLARFARLGWRNSLLLAEALLTLAYASAAIRLLPFRRVVDGVARNPRTGGGYADTARLTWAVQACRNRVPWKAVCFQSALCLQIMLRRRGVRSVLHYGIANAQEEPLRAHVWLSVDGITLLGGHEAPRFTCVATFPPTSVAR